MSGGAAATGCSEVRSDGELRHHEPAGGLESDRFVVADAEAGKAASGRRWVQSLEVEIGPLRLNISGCINACGHRHAADIGILGVDKKGVEHYQITVGGRAGEAAAVGRIIGPSFAEDEVPGVIETIVDTYVASRRRQETFADFLRRVDVAVLKDAVYGGAAGRAAGNDVV